MVAVALLLLLVQLVLLLLLLLLVLLLFLVVVVVVVVMVVVVVVVVVTALVVALVLALALALALLFVVAVAWSWSLWNTLVGLTCIEGYNTHVIPTSAPWALAAVSEDFFSLFGFPILHCNILKLDMLSLSLRLDRAPCGIYVLIVMQRRPACQVPLWSVGQGFLLTMLRRQRGDDGYDGN